MKLKLNSRIVFAAAVAAAALLAACEPPPEVEETAEGFTRVEAIEMTLEWRVDGDMAEFIVTSPAQGWVGVGFDPESAMRGADFVIGYVENDGNVVIEDHYGDRLTNHTADTELGGTDDVELIAGELTNDGTMLHFRRPLDSGDEYDNPLTPGETHTILLAYGNANDLTSDHGPDQRTSFDVEF